MDPVNLSGITVLFATVAGQNTVPILTGTWPFHPRLLLLIFLQSLNTFSLEGHPSQNEILSLLAFTKSWGLRFIALLITNLSFRPRLCAKPKQPRSSVITQTFIPIWHQTYSIKTHLLFSPLLPKPLLLCPMGFRVCDQQTSLHPYILLQRSIF